MKTAREFAHRNGPLRDRAPTFGQVDACEMMPPAFPGGEPYWYHCDRCDDETETIEVTRADAFKAAATVVEQEGQCGDDKCSHERCGHSREWAGYIRALAAKEMG